MYTAGTLGLGYLAIFGSKRCVRVQMLKVVRVGGTLVRYARSAEGPSGRAIRDVRRQETVVAMEAAAAAGGALPAWE